MVLYQKGRASAVIDGTVPSWSTFLSEDVRRVLTVSYKIIAYFRLISPPDGWLGHMTLPLRHHSVLVPPGTKMHNEGSPCPSGCHSLTACFLGPENHFDLILPGHDSVTL